MYPTSGATIRGDIAIKVEEGAAADNWIIGDRVMPPLPVDVRSGKYPKLKLAAAELLAEADTIRTRGGSYGKIARAWTEDTYDCVDRGLEEPIDDTDQRDLARFFNVEVTAARLTYRNMRLAHERRVAAAIFNTTNFGAATNSAVAYTVANLNTVSFVSDVLAAIERVNDKGAVANTIVMSSAVYARIRQALLVKDWVGGSLNRGATVTADTIAQAFSDVGITQCLVGRSRYNSAGKGKDYVAAPVWSNTYVWVGSVNRSAGSVADIPMGGAGYTMVWNAEGGVFVTETYRDEKHRSNMVRVRQNTDEKITDGTAGTLIATQFA